MLSVHHYNPKTLSFSSISLLSSFSHPQRITFLFSSQPTTTLSSPPSTTRWAGENDCAEQKDRDVLAVGTSAAVSLTWPSLLLVSSNAYGVSIPSDLSLPPRFSPICRCFPTFLTRLDLYLCVFYI
ncbi:hypothetical protein SLA2020_452190 [Shorea laevis]